MFDIKVISLERTPERLDVFRKQNSHIKYSVFPAIEGNLVSESDRKKFIDASYSYRAGALGNALSHQKLWNEVISKGRPLTICEDDAIFHQNFECLSGKVLTSLGVDWDICLWGWNFDSILLCNLPQGLSNCSMTFDQNTLRTNFVGYMAEDLNPLPLKLLQCFGTICYSISPKGAQNFLAQTQPIKKMNVFFPTLNMKLENVALDISMNAFYAINQSYASFPPLVITKNEVEISTVQQTEFKQIRLYI
ncbi:glycosyltransferase family 25 protein [Polynucleobacter sp. UB-Raua-W9]|uniref:glycosyltransferase family 25 protein n=1 Tax=Polynucleobacter sp. UB-Raua-W9 TaxID=1819736 RepID=UPI001BFDCEC9|nr:glycosyltransferase family 25 protein [Polynucleobacter sp. UB-Raua-W9]QWD72183.1 glycosyltransferase family 25 protein [Polynucleobacter sp. UB-Raua-W9]